MCRKVKSKNSRGFTLVELMVVIAIIAILISILVPALSAVFESGRRKACTAEIQQLQAAISLYDDSYRDFPPSRLTEIGLRHSNEINVGIETLVLCLSTPWKNSSYFEFRDQQLSNSDGDRAPVPLKKITGSVFNSDELFEMVDPWDNPYIYFHYRQLQETTADSYILQGKATRVRPLLQSGKTGRIHGAGSYQLFSCGPDGQQHTQDDLLNQ